MRYRVSLRTDVGLEKTMELETNFQRATIPRLGQRVLQNLLTPVTEFALLISQLGNRINIAACYVAFYLTGLSIVRAYGFPSHANWNSPAAQRLCSRMRFIAVHRRSH